MKRIIPLILLISLPLFSQTLYKDKIWYIKPQANTKTVKTDNFIMFSSNLSGLNNFYPFSSKALLTSTFHNCFINEANFTTSFQTEDTDKLIPEGKGERDILIPYKNYIYFLLKDSKNICYYIYRYDIKNKKSKFILKLTQKYYPGYSATDKVKQSWKENPSFKKDWFNFINEFAEFRKGWAFKDKLILYYAPDYGLFFGRALIINLKTKKVEKTIERVDTVFGANENHILYTKLVDDDATTVGDDLYLFKNGKEYKIDKFDRDNGAFLNGNTVAYTKENIITLYNIKTGKRKEVLKLNLKLPVVLGVSKTGNRIFIGEREDKKQTLYLYDLYSKKLITILPHINRSFPSNFYVSYDGEYASFSVGENFYRIYLNDNSKPSLYVKIKGLIDSKTFKDKVKATVYFQDKSFVSGTNGEFKVNGKLYKEKTITLPLKEGVNKFVFEAKDRAGNTVKKAKKIIYEKPIKTTIKEIDNNPEKFKDKFVILEGFAWGWANIKDKKEVEKYSKLPFAKNNTGLSRSDGSFSDGELRILLPHFSTGSKNLTILGQIKLKNGKWLLKPINTM
ncbi:hypothetical protein TTHT_1803 [Thermotomaculum hydrothermale]|uniref:Uncharacterized protein n=1 Tax=Thermotomaculum hydrothermale TaxID=981385 RepID=A0A7R6SZ15_9BACT|nr:hypothetical protein [Thermotomaculum hydrothermale]BBB33265.1 hypothetical protein TTHT_1803 [Thermotomaculum hydrothermale]